MTNSLTRKKTAEQSATIRASVEEARQKKGWHVHPVFRPGRPSKPKLAPTESWWIGLSRDAFAAEVHRRSDLREQQQAEHSMRAPNELGVA